MKCVGIQHIEAVRRLKEQGKKFKRTIHLVFVPEEEVRTAHLNVWCELQKYRQVGGLEGMKLFVHTPEFKAMNVGFGLDEGIAGPKEVMPLFYGERNVFWIKVNSNWQKAYLESIEGDLPWKSWTWIHVPGEHCRGKGSIYDQQTFGLQAT